MRAMPLASAATLFLATLLAAPASDAAFTASPATASPTAASASTLPEAPPAPSVAPSVAPPVAPPADAPVDVPVEVPVEVPQVDDDAPQVDDDPDLPESSGADPAGLPSEETLPDERPTRAYIVVDRISTAAGVIESEDESVIVLRDDRGRVRTFTKNRVMRIVYLLDGPAGRRVRVQFNDGRALIGSLVEDGYTHVVVEIAGISTRYAREAVESVRPYPTDEELYERFRLTIEPDQYAARYTLAFWLYNKKMYAESKRELESLLEATNHFEAKQLLTEVNAQLTLLESPVGDEPSERRPRTPRQEQGARADLLSADDVNLIRVYEIDLKNPPRLQVPKSLITTMLERFPDHELMPVGTRARDAFYAREPIDIVRTLFGLKARDLYGEVKVLGEPESLNIFRQRVHNSWIITNCATSRCHGGPGAGRLFLHHRNFKEPEVRMTNLLILTRTDLDTLPLIDFDRPTDSLAYQYALPLTEARRPHPQVRGWEPALPAARRGLREDFVRWVRSMQIQRGEYPIEYTPPGLRRPERQMPGGPDR